MLVVVVLIYTVKRGLVPGGGYLILIICLVATGITGLGEISVVVARPIPITSRHEQISVGEISCNFNEIKPQL